MRVIPWVITGLCVAANLASLALIIQSAGVRERARMQRLAGLAARVFWATVSVCVLGGAVTIVHGPAPAPGSAGRGGTVASATFGTLAMAVVFSLYPAIAAVWLRRKARQHNDS
jgi:hypothetical protein